MEFSTQNDNEMDYWELPPGIKIKEERSAIVCEGDATFWQELLISIGNLTGADYLKTHEVLEKYAFELNRVRIGGLLMWRVSVHKRSECVHSHILKLIYNNSELIDLYLGELGKYIDSLISDSPISYKLVDLTKRLLRQTNRSARSVEPE